MPQPITPGTLGDVETSDAKRLPIDLVDLPTLGLPHKRSHGQRLLVVVLLIAAVAAGHWATPVSPLSTYAAHVVLQKLFILPIVLAAIWFGLRGSLLAAAATTLIYAPYIVAVWAGRHMEHVNQTADIAIFWIIGALAGWLVDREHTALHQSVEISHGALKALLGALDAREHQTQQHSHRVAQLSYRIGLQLRLSPDELPTLTQAAMLHDVGKIGISDAVLLKPGPLDDQERRHMQQHAEMGYRILSSAPHLRRIAELVYAHHERFNGHGYPRALAGQQIPLGARIFAVADVYDALTSDRPYRKAMTHAQAIKIILEETGTHFDPQVVQAFLAVLDQPHADAA